MLWQYRHQAEDQRQFAVIGTAEIEPYRKRIQRFRLGNLGIILAVIGPPLVAQQAPRKQHVLGDYRFSIRETRLGIDVESDKSPSVVGLHAFGQQAVEREGLVIA